MLYEAKELCREQKKQWLYDYIKKCLKKTVFSLNVSKNGYFQVELPIYNMSYKPS